MVANWEGPYKIIKSLQNEAYCLESIDAKHCLGHGILLIYKNIMYKLLDNDDWQRTQMRIAFCNDRLLFLL